MYFSLFFNVVINKEFLFFKNEFIKNENITEEEFYDLLKKIAILIFNYEINNENNINALISELMELNTTDKTCLIFSLICWIIARQQFYILSKQTSEEFHKIQELIKEKERSMNFKYFNETIESDVTLNDIILTSEIQTRVNYVRQNGFYLGLKKDFDKVLEQALKSLISIKSFKELKKDLKLEKQLNETSDKALASKIEENRLLQNKIKQLTNINKTLTESNVVQENEALKVKIIELEKTINTYKDKNIKLNSNEQELRKCIEKKTKIDVENIEDLIQKITEDELKFF